MMLPNLTKKQRKKLNKEGYKMCKIMGFAGLKPEKEIDVWAFAEKARVALTMNGDRDGFGYMAMDANGELFGERWMDVLDAFKNRTQYTAEEASLYKKFRNGVFGKPAIYNGFGKGDADSVVAMGLHARMSTNEKILANTHPFVTKDGKTALIHNGVITNQKDLINETSTCDSECILNSYSVHDVSTDPTKIAAVANDLKGGYACVVMGQDAAGVHYLDVFKNDYTNLVVGYIKELDVAVFCTNVEILKAVCTDMQYTLTAFFYVKPNVMMRINAMTGDVMGSYAFKSNDPASGQFPQRANNHGWSRGTARASVIDMSRTRLPNDAADDADLTDEELAALMDPFYVNSGT